MMEPLIATAGENWGTEWPHVFQPKSQILIQQAAFAVDDASPSVNRTGVKPVSQSWVCSQYILTLNVHTNLLGS